MFSWKTNEGPHLVIKAMAMVVKVDLLHMSRQVWPFAAALAPLRAYEGGTDLLSGGLWGLYSASVRSECMAAAPSLSLPENRLAVLLIQSGCPSWVLLKLAVELERHSKLFSQVDFLSAANAITDFVEMEKTSPAFKKALPSFQQIMDEMRTKDDARKLKEIFDLLDEAIEAVAKHRSPVQSVAQMCMPHLRHVMSALKHPSIAAPAALQLPITNNAYTLEVAGLCGVIDQANERSLTMREANNKDKERYKNAIAESRKTAEENAKTDAKNYVKSASDAIKIFIANNTKTFVDPAIIARANALSQDLWKEAMRQNARNGTVALPDGHAMTIRPTEAALPAGTLLSMRFGQNAVAKVRRSGGIGGTLVMLTGGAAIVAGTGGAGAIPLVIAGACQVAGGLAWGASNWFGRKDNHAEWQRHFESAMSRHEADLARQLMAAWDASKQRTETEVESFFGIERRQATLQRISEVANTLAERA